jgi:hypothetical protein
MEQEEKVIMADMEADENYSCIMEPVEGTILVSETHLVDVETREIIGTQRSIPCPGIVSDEGEQGPIMYFFDDNEMGRMRHQSWLRRIGKK